VSTAGPVHGTELHGCGPVAAPPGTTPCREPYTAVNPVTTASPSTDPGQYL
jgi:hypothetical protein